VDSKSQYICSCYKFLTYYTISSAD